MQEELLSRLDALAATLGVAVEQVFEIYVRQAPLLTIDAALSVLMAIIVGFSVLYCTRKMKGDPDFYDSGWFIGSIFLGIAFLICSLFAVADTAIAIKAILNPEYFALTEITKLLR